MNIHLQIYNVITDPVQLREHPRRLLLKAGQFLSYPIRAQAAGGDGGNQTFGTTHATNPYTNALYATLLHAIGKHCDGFNRPAASLEPALYGPLGELLKT